MKSDRELLKEANELIRSFKSIVNREGKETNWDAIGIKTNKILAEQHKVLNDNITSNEWRHKSSSLDEKWEPLAFVNAAPDEGYPIRILEAHLRNCTEGIWVGESPLVEQMNKWQNERAVILQNAIHKLFP